MKTWHIDHSEKEHATGCLAPVAPLSRSIQHGHPPIAGIPTVQRFLDSVFLDPVDKCLAADVETVGCDYEAALQARAISSM